MNWGLRIVLSLAAFIIFILIMVYQALQEDVNLVAENYYEQEIKFQDHLNRISNAQKLPSPVDMRVDRNAMQVTFQFPGSLAVMGEFHFFRPSDNTLDQKIPIQLDSGMSQRIPIGHLRRGLWKVKIRWRDEETEYFQEILLII